MLLGIVKQPLRTIPLLTLSRQTATSMSQRHGYTLYLYEATELPVPEKFLTGTGVIGPFWTLM